MQQRQVSSPQLRFYPYSPAPGDNPSCESPGCRNMAAWWEETHNAFLCDGCVIAFEQPTASLSPLREVGNVLSYLMDVIPAHCGRCAECQRIRKMVSTCVASMAIAECLADKEGLAWVIQNKLLTLNTLAELIQVHLCGKVWK